MGALIELLSPDASVVARAFTDDHGHYLLRSVVPGNYRLRATAAFLLPANRGNVRVHAGVLAIANLTMTAIFEATNWLPTERRRAGDPADDWQWTLRSTANRPLLRLVDDGPPPIASSSSSSTDHQPRTRSEGQVTFLAGDGSFGQGGAHQVIMLDHAGADGAISMVHANLGDTQMAGGPASVMVTAGLERQRSFGGSTRLLVSVESHPELQAGGGSGFQVLRSATAQKIVIGDTFIVDAGTLFTAEKLLGSRFSSAPYVRVAFRAGEGRSLEYHLATDRRLQRTEDLDELSRPEEILADAAGQPLVRKGLHQEVAFVSSSEGRTVSVAVYRDAVPVEGVQGGGVFAGQALEALPVISDPSTGTFRMAFQGLSSEGLRVSWNQTVSSALSICIDGELGKALQAEEALLSAPDVSRALQSRTAGALRAAVQLQSRRTGSLVNVRYRWQPYRTLTQVDEFDAMPGDAYLGVGLKQRLWSGRRLKGVNAVVEATNLLAEGYEPLLGPDGETLFLAQVPRGVLGGLSFSF